MRPGALQALRPNTTPHAQAFTRTVQQEPDNGDAWANIAAVHLQHRTWQPAFAAAAEVRTMGQSLGWLQASKIWMPSAMIKPEKQCTQLLTGWISHWGPCWSPQSRAKHIVWQLLLVRLCAFTYIASLAACACHTAVDSSNEPPCGRADVLLQHHHFADQLNSASDFVTFLS